MACKALLQNVPPGGYPAVSSGVLDEETVWGVVLRNHFGFKLCVGCAGSTGVDQGRKQIALYNASSPEMRAGIQQWISKSAGTVGGLIFRCIDTGFAHDVIPLGLVCDIVATDAGGAKVREAAVRLERFTRNRPITNENARTWARATHNLIKGWTKKANEILLRSLWNAPIRF